MSAPGCNPIETDRFSAQLRVRAVDVRARRLLVANLSGSQQERDLSVPPNCGGIGRVRHFRRATSPGWPPNPLPIDPACRALGRASTDQLEAQAFQNAACNWRCWYCYVPFALLSADERYSQWVTPANLVERYLAEPDRPRMIDLTGGQPDLAPEWVPWMMEELTSHGLERSVYLWSDDNLSNDYFFRFLSKREQDHVVAYPMYGRVACFKGFNAQSFAFNTQAEAALYDRQFELMGRMLALGLDIYAYATFTTPSPVGIADDMARFVDRLQKLDPNLPLRTVPLEIREFTPVTSRLNPDRRASMDHQQRAVEAWVHEIDGRFPSIARACNIVDVSLAGRAPRAAAPQ